METIYKQLENLAHKFTLLARDYKIPDSHIGSFQEFMLEYQNYGNFFNNIDNIETEIFPLFANNISKNIEYSAALTSNDINHFLSGNIIIKTFCDKQIAEKLRIEINNILNTSKNVLSPKLLHIFIPDIVKLIHNQHHLIIDTVRNFFYKSEEISFELGFFNIRSGTNSMHWHDDYTLFCNKISGSKLEKKLLLNFHIALTDVSEASSPLSFLKGTENIVYARSAIKYFKDNNIRFDEKLFLKAVFLTENLYSPGEEVKANFIGLLPSISYRIHQFQHFNKRLEIFYNELKAGQVQIFSPHLSHTSPFVNSDNFSRETLVLRFFAGSDYNYRNVITVKDFINSLSVVKARQLSIQDIQNHFFKGIDNLNYDSKMSFNVYINKGNSSNELQYPRIYLEDLYNFFG